MITKKRMIGIVLIFLALAVGFFLLPGPKRVPYSQQTSADSAPVATAPAQTAPEAPGNLTPMP